jgi:predicted transcriptional regulator
MKAMLFAVGLNELLDVLIAMRSLRYVRFLKDLQRTKPLNIFFQQTEPFTI